LLISDPSSTGIERVENMDMAYISFGDPALPSLHYKYFVGRNILKHELYDVAVLTIKNPDDKLPRALYLQNQSNQVMEHVHLIGYGHINQPDKHIDLKCEVVHPNSVLLSEQYVMQNETVFKKDLMSHGKDPNLVDEYYCGFNEEHRLLLHTSMEYGASGAPIINITGKGRQLAVVGVFIGAIPKFFFKLSKEKQRCFPDEHRIEYGARMDYIYKELNKFDSSLAAEVFG